MASADVDDGAIAAILESFFMVLVFALLLSLTFNFSKPTQISPAIGNSQIDNNRLYNKESYLNAPFSLKCICVVFSILLCIETITILIDTFGTQIDSMGYHWFVRLIILFLAFINLYLLPIIFITRLYVTFKNTKYEYSQKCYVLLIFTCWFIFIGFSIVAYIMYERFEFVSQFGIAMLALFCCIVYIVLCIVIVHLFIRLLHKITMESAELLMDNNYVIDIISKYSILLLSGNISTILMFLWMVMEAVLGTSVLGWSLLSFDCFIKMLTLYLQYPFGDHLYHSICAPCERCCNNKVKLMTNDKVQLTAMAKMSHFDEIKTLI